VQEEVPENIQRLVVEDAAMRVEDAVRCVEGDGAMDRAEEDVAAFVEVEESILLVGDAAIIVKTLIEAKSLEAYARSIAEKTILTRNDTNIHTEDVVMIVAKTIHAEDVVEERRDSRDAIRPCRVIDALEKTSTQKTRDRQDELEGAVNGAVKNAFH
jgi:hypothetical protein